MQLNLDLIDIASYEAEFEATSLTRAAPVGVSFEAAVSGVAAIRAAVQHVATQARMTTLKENADVVQAVEWVSTLDSKTSNQCRTLDKRRFKLTEGPRPPIHINCRSTVVAVTRFSKLFAEGATRASVGDDGPQQVRADLSYYDWLEQQPAAFQDKAIGRDVRQAVSRRRLEH